MNPYLSNELKGMELDIRYRGHWVNLCTFGKRLKLGTRQYEVAPIKIGFEDRIIQLKRRCGAT